MDSSLLDSVKEYDVCCFFETFVEKKDVDGFNSIFKGYDLTWVYAERKCVMGRASGGCLIMVKENYNSCIKCVKLGGRYVIAISKSKQICYILPVYLNPSAWENDFYSLKDYLLEWSGNHFIIMGDVNARTGTGQTLIGDILSCSNELVNLQRNSRDHTLNRNGKLMLELMAEFNLVILNGRTRNDIMGECTFIAERGSSVIDLCCVHSDLLQYVHSFSVGIKTHSDHMPIILYLNLGQPIACNNTPTLAPKLKWCNERKDDFCSRLNLCMKSIICDSGSIDNKMYVLDCIIKEAARYKPERKLKCRYRTAWFDKECEVLRRVSFHKLKQFRRTNNIGDKLDYVQHNKLFKQLCINKQNKHYLNCITSINNARSTKEFWEGVNNLKNKKALVLPNNIAPEKWIEHFLGLFSPISVMKPIQYACPLIINEELDKPFSVDELCMVLSKCKGGKSPGPNRIPYEFYVNATPDFHRSLVKVFNDIFTTATVPMSFKESVIFPLYKSGNKEEVKNYRGISLNNVNSKIFESLLLERLSKWAEQGILKESQAGFRVGYSTLDNIFTLCNIVQLKMTQKRQKVYAFFIDFSAAFDTVDRNLLFYKLSTLGMSTKMMDAVKALLTGTRSSVWYHEGVTNEFNIDIGVKQGAILSPLLFALFLNDLEDALDGGGIMIGNCKIKMLGFADDVVVLSSNPLILQKMINSIEKYVGQCNMRLNLNKSKVMIFRKGGKLARNERWTFNGQPVQVVNEYKYLGLTISSKITLRKHMECKSMTAKKSINALWSPIFENNKILPEAKIKLFKSCIRTLICYGAQIWGCKPYEDIEKVMRFFLKKLFRLPSWTPTAFLCLETNTEPLHLHTLKLHCTYLIKIMTMSSSRYPHIVAKECMKKKAGWYSDLTVLLEKMELPFAHLSSMGQECVNGWASIFTDLQAKLLLSYKQSYEDKVGSSLNFQVHKYLNFNLGGKNYISNSAISMESKRFIIKMRGEILLKSGSSCFNEQPACLACGIPGMQEDLFHFLAECRRYADLREKWFNVPKLDCEAALNLLNGCNWHALCGFGKEAYELRASFN